MLLLFQLCILAEERLEFWLCYFLFLRQEHVHVNLFFTKIVCNKITRSLDCLNRCKVLSVYVDITVLVLQKKLTEPSINIYPLKVKKVILG